MSFADRALGRERPASIRRNVPLPRRQRYFASPVDWRDEVLYFLLVDRFSDAREGSRPLLDRADLASARRMPGGNAWRWDRWAESGASRWQGGTLRGTASKLPYLESLGVTTLWLSPVFKQRGHADSYHGYGVQDFLDVDPRLGDRGDLVDLLAAAPSPPPSPAPRPRAGSTRPARGAASTSPTTRPAATSSARGSASVGRP